MLIIGENINATNKTVGSAIARRDVEFISQLARDQVAAGADFIDVNAGEGANFGDTSAIEWLVETVQEAVKKPLTIDSDAPEIISAGLKKYHGEGMMINSVTAEPQRLHNVGPIAADKKASLVALAMDSSGIPPTVEKRLEACETIMRYLTGLGMLPEQIYFDPLVLPISVDSNQGMVTLKTIEQIKAHLPGAKTVMGLSNISYGIPGRKLVNRSFLLMAVYAGLDAAILNPLDKKIMTAVRVAELLTGSDHYCRKYVRSYRQGTIEE